MVKSALVFLLMVALHSSMPKRTTGAQYYEDSFVSDDGLSSGSVRVSKDGRTVTSRSHSRVVSSGSGHVSVSSSSSSSVSSVGGRAHGKATVRTRADGESHKYKAEVGKEFDVHDFIEDSFIEMRRREK